MRVLQFVARWRGIYCTYPGGVGRQCVDLANQYLADVWHQPAQRLNAVDWAGIHLPGMVWTPNGPTNHPELGALVVWGPYASEHIGGFGHIAVAVAGDAMELLSFDQNWPAGSVCSLVSHDYGGVLGWHALAG